MSVLTSDQQKVRNIERSERPQAGDYWHEMFSPMALVVHAGPYHVAYLHKTKEAQGGWTWDESQVAIKTPSEFATWLRYGSIPGTWADVVPKWHRWKEFAELALASATAPHTAQEQTNGN